LAWTQIGRLAAVKKVVNLLSLVLNHYLLCPDLLREPHNLLFLISDVFLGFKCFLIVAGPGPIPLGIVAKELSKLKDLFIFGGDGIKELSVFHPEAVDDLFLSSEAGLDQFEFLGVRKGVLALNDLLELLTEAGAFLHVGTKLYFHLVLLGRLNVSLDRVKLLGLGGNHDLQILNAPFQVLGEMALEFLHLGEVAPHHS
jgi:hypothetical protein